LVPHALSTPPSWRAWAVRAFRAFARIPRHGARVVNRAGSGPSASSPPRCARRACALSSSARSAVAPPCGES